MRESLFSGCSGYPREHVEAFGDWSLPPWVDEPIRELQRIREGGGFFDGSPWTKILVRGREGLDLLQRVSSNDLTGMGVGDIRPTLLLTEKGRLLDLLHVIRLSGDRLLLIGTPGKEGVIRWLEKYTILEDITYTDITHSVPMALTIGGEAASRLSSLLKGVASQVDPGTGERNGPPILHGRSEGFPFELSFILQLSGDPEELWSVLTSDPECLSLSGVRSFQHARIRSGIPLEEELSAEYNPYDIGLQGAISYSKGCYIGQEVIARLDTYGKVRREPLLLRLKGRMVAQGRVDVVKEGELIGVVTSHCADEDEAGYPAIAIVEKGRCQVGDELRVGNGEEVVDGLVHGLLEGGR